jgi:hypothetical protein
MNISGFGIRKILSNPVVDEVSVSQSSQSKPKVAPDKYCDIPENHPEGSDLIEFIRDELRRLVEVNYDVTKLLPDQRALLATIGPKIKLLEFPGSLVTDEALDMIVTVFPNLESLDLKVALQVTSKGYKSLASLQLKALYIRDPMTYLGPQILEVISKMPLQKLWISSATCSFEDFVQMEKLRLLKVLFLREVKWSAWKAKSIEDGEALKHLTYCPLKYLDLYGTKITDRDLRHFVKLPLEYICLENCNVTKEGFAAFSKALPATEMHHSELPKAALESKSKDKRTDEKKS